MPWVAISRSTRLWLQDQPWLCSRAVTRTEPRRHTLDMFLEFAEYVGIDAPVAPVPASAIGASVLQPLDLVEGVHDDPADAEDRHLGRFWQVIPKEMVNQSTGLPYANALGSMLPTHNTHNTNNYYNGGFVTAPATSSGGTPAVQLVELMPHQLQAIVNGLAVQLTVDGKALAFAANNANGAQARRGNG